MGRDDDRKRREELRRYDDAERRKKVDEAREWVYDKGYAITGDKVEDLLKDQSMIPTKVFASTSTYMRVSMLFIQNAFSSLLSPFGFDFHKMLTVDLLHEVELGVWKALLTHLIRMLNFCGADKVREFDERYASLYMDTLEQPRLPPTSFRMVAAFGDKIRRFEGNVSDMKRLAGHDFEDILQVHGRVSVMGVLLTMKTQCIIPCIEGLFKEPHNSSVIELLYIFATWHALAKLHIHTDTSLGLLDTATTALGNALRYFTRVTCPEFKTVETPAEYAKRQRQQAAAVSSASTTIPSTSTTVSSTSTTAPSTVGRQPRTFSLGTIKLHFLGDYVSCIRMFGTTDNYNSALVSGTLTYHSRTWLIIARGKTVTTG